WGISGRREYAPDTKRACAELNACVRRAKNNSAGRAAPALAAGSSSSKSNQNGSATALKPQPADKQAKGTQSASTSAVTNLAMPFLMQIVQMANRRHVSLWRRSWYR